MCGTNPKQHTKGFENSTTALTVNKLAPGECTLEVDPNSTSKVWEIELTLELQLRGQAGWDLRLQPNWVDFLTNRTNKTLTFFRGF